MNKIVKLSLLSALLLGSVTSCIKETVPTSIVTGDQVSSSDVAIEGMVGAIATNMVKLGTAFNDPSIHYDFGYPAMMIANDALAGEFVCTSSDANAGYDWFSPWSNNIYLGPLYYAPAFYWRNYYTYIKAANDVINTVQNAKDYESNPTLMAYLAIAKIFRASYYLDMARLYDPLENAGTTISEEIKGLTIPYVSESTTEAEARKSPRMPRADIFEKIFADLKAAEDIYTSENGLQPNNGVNPDLAVVYGLYARAYLWLGGVDASDENYKEAIKYADQAIALSGPITTGAEWTSKTDGFNKALDSWMWHLTQSSDSVSNLINYVAWLSPETQWGSYASMLCSGLSKKDYSRLSNSDIRKSVVIGAEVDYEAYKDVTLLDETEFSTMFPYTNFKFRPLGGEKKDINGGAPTDIPLMRVEEMHFIKAEATLHTQGDAAGLEALKVVMLERDPSYDTADVEDALDEIIFQKRMEFWGEGIIVYDLKRLGKGIHTGYNGTNVAKSYRFDFDGVAPSWNICLPEIESYQNTALVGFNNPDPSGTVAQWTEQK